MIQVRRWAMLATLIIVMPASVGAEDAGHSFDCDAMAGPTTKLSQPAALPAVVSGVLEPIKNRRGSYIPQAGVFIGSADEKSGIELVVIRTRWSATQLTPLVYGSTGSSLPIFFPKVPQSEPISFSLSLSASGKAIVVVGKHRATFDAKPLESAKITLFCDSGQFAFSDLNIPIPDRPKS